MITNAKIVSENTDSGLYHSVNDNVQRGSAEYTMSFSELKRFAACPAKWVAGASQEDSSSLKWGAAIDCLVTQPEEFSKRFAIKPEQYQDEKGEWKKWNGNAKVCKEWAENEKREVISKRDFSELTIAVHKLHSDPWCYNVIFQSNKQVYLSAQWKQGNITVPLKCMIDFEWTSFLADLKTSQFVGHLSWPRHCFKFGYHMQAALYLDMYNAARGYECATDFYHICQESSPPYQIGRRLLSQEFIQIGRDSYQQILGNYVRCLSTNRWPGYDDHEGAINGCTLIEPEAWMIESDYRNHKMTIEEDDNEQN